MLPSDVVKAYRCGSRAANRLGEKLKPDKRRLEALGFSPDQVDAIFAEIEWCRTMETNYRLRMNHLDKASSVTNGERDRG